MKKKPLDRQVVRAMGWLLLYGRAKARIGAERWEALERAVGAPPFKTMDPAEPTPLATFNAALRHLAAEAGTTDVAREAAEDSAEGWGNQNRDVVRSLRGKPAEMMHLLVTQAHPWFMNEPEIADVLESGPEHMLVRLHHDVLDDFVVGLFTGFCRLTGAEARVEIRGEKLYHVSWSTPDPVDPDSNPN